MSEIFDYINQEKFLIGSNSPSSSALPEDLILLPRDFPSELDISCNFTGSIVEIAANKTKNANKPRDILAKKH